MELLETTREKIKAAALEIFMERGYDGARMQEIADRAGANKAMIHYYFSSKDALFEALIRETFEELFKLFDEMGDFSYDDPKKWIEKIVQTHFNFIAAHPNLPRVMVRELNSNNPIVEQVLADLMKQFGARRLAMIVSMIRDRIAAGKLRAVDPKQTMWNIVALNIFYFAFKPFIQAAWPEDVNEEAQLLQQREQAIIDLLLYGLLPR